jgi:hypothetical protein
MNRDEIRQLEEACERVLTEVVRKHFEHAVEPRVFHLMAKAAVTVLEAVDESKGKN